jgi:predicted O-linked N-acetylglucosamine transferase (SPINDLY family)
VDRHAAGDLEAAENGYRDFLSRHDGFAVAYSNLAALLLGRGAHGEAASLALRAVELQPQYRSGWQNRFEALLGLGQRDAALTAGKQLLELDRADSDVAHRLALLWVQDGNDDQALAILNDLLASRPDHLPSLQTLGVLQLKHDPVASLDTTAAAIALAPHHPDLLFNHAQALLATGQGPAGEELLREVLQGQPQHRQACQRLTQLLDARGEHGAALDRYEAAVDADPTWTEGWFQLGLRRLQQQREGGCEAYERLLELDPNHAMALSNLAVQQLGKGDLAGAAERLERAVELQPDFVDGLFNLSLVRTHQGKRINAEELYRKVMELRPSYAKAACNLGSLLNDRGAFSEAQPLLEHALQLQPDLSEALFNLGVSLANQGQWDQAELQYRQCLSLRPDFTMGWLQLGNLLDSMGRHVQAIEAYDKVLALEPGNLQGSINRAIQHLKLGQGSHAVEALQTITSQHPEAVLAWQQLANALLETSQYEASLAASDRAIELSPLLPVPHSNRGVALQNLKRIDEAEQCYRRAVELEPGFTDAHYNLGVLLKERGCFVAAAECYRKAIKQRPGYSNALANLVYLLSFSQIESQQTILEASRQLVNACCVPKLQPFQQRPIPTDRPLRLGVISAEIGNHAVSYFLRSYLRNYDHKRTHVHLYPTIKRDEPAKHELVTMVEGTRELHALSDAEARERIMDDGIDILVDTTSHMRGNRLPLLAERCAPVQAHWIGFHGSTAVPTVDWFIGDDEVSPEEFADHFSERLWRLPMPWVVYSPPLDAPEPEEIEDVNRPVTLGSFNNLLKVGDASIDLYGQVLRAIPGSRLLLKDVRCEDGFMRDRILSRLTRWGLGPERVEMVARVPSWHEHMKLYNRLDIALDTTPLNSGTTGFDALFMGTPLVALRGDWMGGRLTASMLKALGRSEWVAETTEEFVSIVTSLSADRQGLRSLRHELRQQVLTSPLCDGAAMGRAMDEALAGMARHHNEQLQGASAC